MICELYFVSPMLFAPLPLDQGKDQLDQPKGDQQIPKCG
nr:MAG TPA_asm: hypothetical protein [Caudoviricetes sp.]